MAAAAGLVSHIPPRGALAYSGGRTASGRANFFRAKAKDSPSTTTTFSHHPCSVLAYWWIGRQSKNSLATKYSGRSTTTSARLLTQEILTGLSFKSSRCMACKTGLASTRTTSASANIFRAAD